MSKWLSWSSPRTWIAILVLSVIAGELSLRALGYGRFVLTYSSARYGWRYPPGIEYVDAPVPVAVRINDHGFRDRDFGEARADASKWRLAIVGNSVVWGGGGLAVEERFDALLAPRLQSALQHRGDARTVETLNFAQPGYALEQSARVWEDEARPFRPDVVLVPILPSDVRPMRQMEDAPRYPFSDFVRRSATRDWIQRAFLGGWGAGVTPEQRAVESAVRSDPYAPAHEALWSAMFARIDGMQRTAAGDGGRLVLVSLPTLDELLGRCAQRVASRVAPWALEHAIAYVDAYDDFEREMRPLLDELARRGTALDTVWSRANAPERPPAFDEAAHTCFFFHDPDHLTARGHAVLAESLARELERLGLP